MRRKLLQLIGILCVMLSGCNSIYVEADNTKLKSGSREKYFYTEGGGIDEVTESSIVEVVELEKDKVNSDMLSLVMDLKNNNLIAKNIIYINKDDANIVNVFDRLEAYNVLKSKRTRLHSEIRFSNKDELAIALGFESSSSADNLMGKSKLDGRKIGDVSNSSTLAFDDKGFLCTSSEPDIIFEIEGNKCKVTVNESNLINILNLKSDEGEYAVNLKGIKSAYVIGKSMLLKTEDEYSIYIDMDNFVKAMGGKNWVYLNKIDGFESVYGFAVNVNYLTNDFSYSAAIIAEMYEFLDIKNDWSKHIRNKGSYVELNDILVRYGVFDS